MVNYHNDKDYSKDPRLKQMINNVCNASETIEYVCYSVKYDSYLIRYDEYDIFIMNLGNGSTSLQIVLFNSDEINHICIQEDLSPFEFFMDVQASVLECSISLDHNNIVYKNISGSYTELFDAIWELIAVGDLISGYKYDNRYDDSSNDDDSDFVSD